MRWPDLRATSVVLTLSASVIVAVATRAASRCMVAATRLRVQALLLCKAVGGSLVPQRRPIVQMGRALGFKASRAGSLVCLFT